MAGTVRWGTVTVVAVAADDQAALRDTVAAHGGVPVDVAPRDGGSAAFPRASDAVACAVALHRALRAAGSPPVAMGVHTGDDLGAATAGALALRDSAGASGVFLAPTTAGLVRDNLPEGTTVVDLGLPAGVTQLIHPDLPPAAPARHANLPLFATSFIGRRRDLADVRALLDQDRLVTLTGAGGCGKTRLAIEATREVDESRAGVVSFVDLSRFNDAAAGLDAIAASLGIMDAQRASIETVANFVGDRGALLVLDNCEHLVAFAADLAATLLRHCPAVTILATSREPLGAPGEASFRVPSLPIPTSEHVPPTDALDHDAVRLFVERARRARPDFALDATNTPAVIEICRRLDGLPLAIELAAARLRVLGPAQMLEGLHDRFRLLTGGARTTIARHQTLQASVDWSYALLLDAERAVLNRLSVFAGGFTLDAAEAIATGGGVERHHIADIVLQLVDKSLVIAGDDRFSLLETVRQYGAERLAEAGDADATRLRHYEHFRDLAGRLQAGNILRAAEPIDGDYENFRRALQWAANQPDAALLARLADRLYFYWSNGRQWNDAARWYTQVAQAEHDPRRRGRALGRLSMLTIQCGDIDAAERFADDAIALLRESGDSGALLDGLLTVLPSTLTDAHFDEALALADELGLAFQKAWALYRRAGWRMGADPEAGAADYDEALRVARRADLGPVMQLWVDAALTYWQVAAGEVAGAIRALDACLDELVPAGHLSWSGPLLGAAAMLHQMTGDEAGADSAVAGLDALADQEESHHLSWYRLMGRAALALVRGEVASASARLRIATGIPLMPLHRSIALRNLALCDALTGRADDAVAHAEEAARLARADGTDRLFGLLSYVPRDLPLAVAARAEGQWSRAEDLAHSALAEVQAAPGPLYTRALTVLVLASIWAQRERYEEAVRLCAGVRANGERDGVVWDAVATSAYEGGCRDVARGALGDEVFAAAWAEGAAMSWGEVIAYGQRGWGPRNRAVYGWDALTPTERQVVELVVAGATNKEVAGKLFMSVATVKTHLTRVYAKVGVTSRTQLAAIAHPVGEGDR